MRCDKYKIIINDFFNKALSPAEEHELEGHLALCANCRLEFHELKSADSMLREAVRDMMSDIEVPNDLNQKIKKALAMKQKKTTKRRGLLKFFGSPAVAAALLIFVMGAGLFKLFDPYSQDIRQQVFMSDKSGVVMDKVEAEPSVPPQPSPESTIATARELQSNLSLGSGMAEDSNAAIDPSASERRSSSMIAQSTRSREILSPAGGSPIDETKDLEAQKEKFFSATTFNDEPAEAPAGLGGGASDVELFLQPETGYLKKGSVEEAARETGINPVTPAYLPTGAVLTEVSWLPMVVNQNYRVGEDNLLVRQIRLDPAENYGVKNLPGNIMEINGVGYHIYETTVGETVKNITIEWQKGMFIYNLSGNLPLQDMIRIASSIE